MAALGIAAFFFENVFDFAGIDPGLPLFAFVFLVALGIDYNIFLMARVREETLTHGTRDGTIRGLAVDRGGNHVSRSRCWPAPSRCSGILPLVSLTEIGFTIAVELDLARRATTRSIGEQRHRRPLVAAQEHGPGDRGRSEPVAHLVGRGIESAGTPPVERQRELDGTVVLEVAE